MSDTVTLREILLKDAEGVGPVMTPAGLQAALDGYRQLLADKAAWQANAAAAVSALK